MSKDIKKELISAKNWILKNQKDNGEILWDDKGKWDFWDHCECLIALSIYEEWDAFRRGLDFCLSKVDQEGLVKSQYIDGKISQDYFEAHHAPYIFLPLLQKYFIDKDINYLLRYRSEIHQIYKGTLKFKDADGYYHWALDQNGLADDSLVTSSCSLELSRRAYNKICKLIQDEDFIDPDKIISDNKLNSNKFDRGGIDRSRFSMDSYYPMLCNSGTKKDVNKTLNKFYVNGLGIKCVEEEPWVTFAESSECIMALYKIGLKEEAKKIFDEVLKHKNHKGYFPTGYQYELGVYWPEEDSTWTNAAVIMAADCIYDISGKEKVILI